DQEAKAIEVEAIAFAIPILLAAIHSTAQLFEGELGESDHQHKCRMLIEWICKKFAEKGLPIKRKALLQSKQLGGGSDMYDYVLKTLIESGKIEEIQKEKKDEWEYLPKNQVLEEVENG
ncbi:MAG: hypothetical protein WC192_05250, partial [Candidatus Babeliales bacterium]